MFVVWVPTETIMAATATSKTERSPLLPAESPANQEQQGASDSRYIDDDDTNENGIHGQQRRSERATLLLGLGLALALIIWTLLIPTIALFIFLILIIL